MFPKSSFIMILVAGALLLTACLVDRVNGKEINQLYLGLGAVLVIFSTAMLIFKKR